MSLGPFKCEISVDKSVVTWKFSGVMNEHMVIPSIDKTSPLIINLRGVKMVNSYGLKIWTKWINANSDLLSITLEECPYVFVNNFSMINGLVTSNTIIKSFFVPFFNDQSQERRDILFQQGTDYEVGGFLRLPDVKDSQGEYMELDVNPTRYFSFLKRKSKK